MGKLDDIIGRKFGKITVLKRERIGSLKVLCQCDCGITKWMYGPSIADGETVSCGCRRWLNPPHCIKHGHAVGKGSPEYSCWVAMRKRCLNPNNTNYPNYGGRGIWICDRWLQSFEHFLEDMGARPSRLHTIERVNNSLGYSKSNCIWGTRKDQSNNKRDNHIVEFDGQRKNVAQWGEAIGIKARVIRMRLSKGWDIESALTTPLNDFRTIEFQGIRKTCAEWEPIVGIDRKILRQRLDHGWNVQDAMTRPMRKQRSDSKRGRFVNAE